MSACVSVFYFLPFFCSPLYSIRFVCAHMRALLCPSVPVARDAADAVEIKLRSINSRACANWRRVCVSRLRAGNISKLSCRIM